MKRSDVPKPPIDVKSCAEFLGVSPRDIKRMIRASFLEAKKEGNLTLFDLTHLHVLRRELFRSWQEIADKSRVKTISHCEIEAWLRMRTQRKSKKSLSVENAVIKAKQRST